MLACEGVFDLMWGRAQSASQVPRAVASTRRTEVLRLSRLGGCLRSLHLELPAIQLFPGC